MKILAACASGSGAVDAKASAAFLRGLALVIVLIVRLHLYRLATRRL